MKDISASNAIPRITVILLALVLPACSSSLYGWQVRTHSSAPSPTFNHAALGQEPIAIFGALAQPTLQGNEVGMDAVLAQVLKTVAPNIKIIPPMDTATLINRNGLADEYTRMRADALQSAILDRDSLRKLGTAVGARYVFQPRLMAFTQLMTQRWKIPAFEVRMVETRSSIMRVSLQLWDTTTGELLWRSLAETTLQSDGISEDPVYFVDAARVTFGSLLADFLNRKTESTYTPLDHMIDKLIQQSNSENGTNGNPQTGAPSSDSGSGS